MLYEEKADRRAGQQQLQKEGDEKGKREEKQKSENEQSRLAEKKPALHGRARETRARLRKVGVEAHDKVTRPRSQKPAGRGTMA
jgi:hypothetical protein